jgi:hypothetical protein
MLHGFLRSRAPAARFVRVATRHHPNDTGGDYTELARSCAERSMAYADPQAQCSNGIAARQQVTVV